MFWMFFEHCSLSFYTNVLYCFWFNWPMTGHSDALKIIIRHLPTAVIVVFFHHVFFLVQYFLRVKYESHKYKINIKLCILYNHI